MASESFVEPRSAASTASPSRRRVAERILDLAHALEPAVARQNDRHFLVEDEILGLEFHVVPAPAADLGAPLVGEPLGDLIELAANHLPQLALVLEDGLDFLGAPALRRQLLENDLNLQPRQLVQLEFEDGVGLLLVETEALDELASGVRLALRFANDPDCLVERIEDDGETFEEVNAPLELGQLIFEAPGNDFLAKIEELAQESNAG